jgi:hypothetical protein
MFSQVRACFWGSLRGSASLPHLIVWRSLVDSLTGTCEFFVCHAWHTLAPADSLSAALSDHQVATPKQTRTTHPWLARQRASQSHLSHRPAAKGWFLVAGR